MSSQRHTRSLGCCCFASAAVSVTVSVHASIGWVRCVAWLQRTAMRCSAVLCCAVLCLRTCSDEAAAISASSETLTARTSLLRR